MAKPKEYFFRGIGFCSTGVLGIAGVCASLPKKLDPEEGCLVTLILLARLEYALSAEIAGLDAGFIAETEADVSGAGFGAIGGGAVGLAGSVVTGLSDLILLLGLTRLPTIYGLTPLSFSNARCQ